ncbi:MAG: metallophosphoesterase family protein [Nannocystis sp.]|uniref:metallophosphoesterase family protein n=1 Tax=Nannocystis sp. TaxID=1962667 RepID=UPI002421C11E|nr:metallophosphoesterase family protein [Nannocystis sp.]MBK9753540.1 metallophosphoesterase family protein [Nannocystis sp.]
MRIAALSDFHIGAHGYMDEFRHRESAFLAFLDQLEGSHDRIILVGDIYQTEHALLPGRRVAAAELARARARVPALCERLRGPQYHYIHGNHDAVAGPELGAPETLEISADGYRVLFIHGHQFDPVFQRARAAAQAATWFTGRLRRAGLRPLAQWFEGRDVAIKHRRFGHIDGPYARAARALLREHAADLVVMGHTHVPHLHRLPEGQVVNTGSCARGRRTHVTIDTAARSVEIHRA